jgi:hypothetical protein
LVAGQSVSVEIVDGPQVAALVRWVRDGRAGLELTDAIDLTALSPKPTRTSVLRRS